jgi:3-hydroxyanthranilate 3,4-dioxygenase
MSPTSATTPPAGTTSSQLSPGGAAVAPPLDLMRWIEEHRAQFKPPVANKYLYNGRDFFVMIIAGPNARNDFHVTNSEEFFYQIQGDITVRTREGGRIVDHRVREGQTLFVPGGVPHSPQRGPNTLGLVVERTRPAGELEHIVFYCEQCGELVHDIEFDCADIVHQFAGVMEAFWKNDAQRTCRTCGTKVEKPKPRAS